MGSSSNATGGDSSDDALTPYLDDDEGNDLGIADLPVDSPVDSASPRQEFDFTCKLCRLANLAVHENNRVVFSSALQNINSITEGESPVSVKADGLKCVCVVEKIASATLGGRTFHKIDVIRKRDIAHVLVKLFNTNTTARRKTSFFPRHCAVCAL